VRQQQGYFPPERVEPDACFACGQEAGGCLCTVPERTSKRSTERLPNGVRTRTGPLTLAELELGRRSRLTCHEIELEAAQLEQVRRGSRGAAG
jgi:hypothetical protein